MKLPNAEVKGENTLLHSFHLPLENRPYVQDNKLKSTYSAPITDAPQSILNIPLISTLVTYHWMHDLNLEVPVLDEEYLSNLNELKGTFENIYNVDFNSEVTAKKTETNTPPSKESLQFFSGGLDSHHTLHVNKHKKPVLFQILGYDVYTDQYLPVYDTWTEKYRAFAEQQKLRYHTVHTNGRWLVHEGAVPRDSEKKLTRIYWTGLRQGVLLVGNAAPLSNRYGELIAPSGAENYAPAARSNPYGTAVNLAPLFKWGGVEMNYCCGGRRFQKALDMKEWLNSGEVYLRVCWRVREGFNCMRCEKCLRTYLHLVVAGVDPGKCGLTPHGNPWSRLLELLKKGIDPTLIERNYVILPKYLKENETALPRESVEFFNYLESL